MSRGSYLSRTDVSSNILLVLLFMVKKEVFEWIRTGQKTIELRRGKAMKGDVAVFQCGRSILRRKIIKKEEGTLTEVLRQGNYKKIIPIANSLEKAIDYLKKLYGTTEGIFTAYFFDLCQLGEFDLRASTHNMF